MTPPKPPKKRYIQETMLRPPSPTPSNNNSSFANNNNGDCAADGLPLSKNTKYAHTSTPSSSSQASLTISEAPVLCLASSLLPTSANYSYSHAPPQGSPHTTPSISSGNGSSLHAHAANHAHTRSRIMCTNSSNSDTHRSCPAPPEVGSVHPSQPGSHSRYSPLQEVLGGPLRSYSLPPTLQMTDPQNQPLSLTLSPKQSTSPTSLAPSSSSQNQLSFTSSPARNHDPNLMTYEDERERSQLQLDRRRNDRDGLDERLVSKKSNCLKRRIIEQESQRSSAQALQDQPLNLKIVTQQDQGSPILNEHSVGIAVIDRSFHRKKLYSQRRSSPVPSPTHPNAGSCPIISPASDAYPPTASACSYTPPPCSPYSSGTPPHPSPSASPSVLDYTTAQGTNHVQTGPVRTVSNSACRYPNASSSPDVVQITKVDASDCVGRNGKRNNVSSPKSYSRSKQPKQSINSSSSDQHANNPAGDSLNASGEESPTESAQELITSVPQSSTRPKNNSSSLPPKKSPSSPGQASPPSTGSPASSPTDKHHEQMLIDCIIVEGIKRNTIDTEKEERNFQLFCRSQRGAEVGVVLDTNGAPPLGKINNRALFAAVNSPTTTGATSCSTASVVGVTSGAATGGGGVTRPTSALYGQRTSSSPSASRDA